MAANATSDGSPRPDRPPPAVEVLAYRVPDAVKASGIGRTKIYEMILSGELESVTIGRRRLIPADALRRLVTPATI